MFVKRQFSLGFLLLEIFLIATALGLFRASQSLPGWEGVAAFLAGASAIGAAIGWLSEQPIYGAVAAVILAAVITCLAMPAATIWA
jgi:hypothetical protein